MGQRKEAVVRGDCCQEQTWHHLSADSSLHEQRPLLASRKPSKTSALTCNLVAFQQQIITFWIFFKTMIQIQTTLSLNLRDSLENFLVSWVNFESINYTMYFHQHGKMLQEDQYDPSVHLQFLSALLCYLHLLWYFQQLTCPLNICTTVLFNCGSLNMPNNLCISAVF